MDPSGNTTVDGAETWDCDTLFWSFWPLMEFSDGPVIAAAGLEDTAKLQSLLDRADLLDDDDRLRCSVDQVHDFMSVTPLLRAIERERPDNVRLLLEYGADPDGVPMARQQDLARRFRRVWYDENECPHDMEISIASESVGTISSQISPPFLSDDELASRRSDIAPFWTTSHCLEVDHSTDEALYHSVVMAGLSTPEILDQLLEAGSDTSAWLAHDTASLPEEDDLLPSQAAISTPLHTAIAFDNMIMLRTLLDRGFSPNARALITGSQALTPAQYAITIGDLETLQLLKAQGADLEIRTPVFGVHILHFAASLLRLDLLRAINLPMSRASTTGMGHSLLHIACLPFNSSEIQVSAPKVSQSIHNIRGMQASYRISERKVKEFNASGYSETVLRPEFEASMRPYHNRCLKQSPRSWDSDPMKYFEEQESVCKFLVQELGAGKIGEQDMHGNTMLHYLAGSRGPNEALIHWLKMQNTGMSVWEKTQNFWGHTPRELYDDSEAARAVLNQYGKEGLG